MDCTNTAKIHHWWSLTSVVSFSVRNFFLRFGLFLHENLGDCLKESAKKSLYLFSPVIVLTFEYYFFGLTASSTLERGVVCLLFNFTLANITLHLMLVNMAKVQFKPIQFAYIYPLAPIIANLLGADTNLEVNLTRMCTVVALLNFLMDVAILSH